MRAFSLLELLLAMAIFAIAAVSLAEAINVISLTVVESTDGAALREEMRGLLLETTRKPDLAEKTFEVIALNEDVRFVIEIEPFTAENNEGQSLEGFFEVAITALPVDSQSDSDPLDSISTLIYPPIFE